MKTVAENFIGTTIEKTPLVLKSKILQEKNDDDINLNNINSDQNLLPHKINIYREQNFESFCNSFFIGSFPYKNGKLIENSKYYKEPNSSSNSDSNGGSDSSWDSGSDWDSTYTDWDSDW